ncbi:MAG: NAD-dependent epimerase/dehydratase family protein [Pseudomonadales bacterium]|nr:NAD-dependent epimerase/dehydratase family protein [Pseudomonadales bacterium]
MRVLVLGGTGFIGQNLVRLLLKNGHEVAVFCRGISEDNIGIDVVRFYGDRDKGVDELSVLTAKWDVCIDLSGYLPQQVRESVIFFNERISHYIYISGIKAFLPSLDAPITEASTKHSCIDDVSQIDNETYGPLKSTCESIVIGAFESRSTIIRPQVVVGQGDRSGRLLYWLARSGNDKVLLPNDGEDYLQFVDVLDVASFIMKVVEDSIYGEFNLSGYRLKWADFSRLLGIKNGVWVDYSILSEANLTFKELPIFRIRGSKEASYMNVSNKKSIASGFSVSDLSETIDRITEWMGQSNLDQLIPESIRNEHLKLSDEVKLIERQVAK